MTEGSLEDEESLYDAVFDNWYWGYKYGSKAVCIKAVEESDMPEPDKTNTILWHRENMGKTDCNWRENDI